MNIFLIFILLSYSAFAQDIDFGEGQKITVEQLEAFKKRLSPTTSDRTFFHWTNQSNGLRWINQQHIDAGEIGFLNRPSGESQAYGPGFYIAEKPTSSKHYGEMAVSITVKKGTLVYDPEIAMETFGFYPDKVQSSLISEKLKLLKPAEDDWYVINNADFTQKVSYGGAVNPEAKVYAQNYKEWSTLHLHQRLKEAIDAGDQDARYLRELLYTSDYMDGVSFAKAMKSNPAAPWSSLNAVDFDRYKKTLEHLSVNYNTFLKKLNSDYPAAILEIYNHLSGKDLSSVKDALRTEGLDPNKLQVTEYQLKALQSNPYLEVEVSRENGKIYASYSHPDAFHYKKLKDKISPELYQKLEKFSNPSLMSDHQLRNSLNKELMAELFDYVCKDGASTRDLFSINVFPGQNDKLVRIFEKTKNPTLSGNLINELDLLVNQETQVHLSSLARTGHKNMQEALYNEYLIAKDQKRMPDYVKTNAVNFLIDESFPVPLKINLNSPAIMDNIQQKNWSALLDQGISDQLDDLNLQIKNCKLTNLDPFAKLSLPNSVEIYSPEQLNRVSDTFYNAIVSKDALSSDEKLRVAKGYFEIVESNSSVREKYQKASTVLVKEFIEDFKKNPLREDIALSAIDSLEKDLFRKLEYMAEVRQAAQEGSLPYIDRLIDGHLSQIKREDLAKLSVEQRRKTAILHNNSFETFFSPQYGTVDLTLIEERIALHKKLLKDFGDLYPNLMKMEEIPEVVVKSQIKLIADKGRGISAQGEALKVYSHYYNQLPANSKKNFKAPKEFGPVLLDSVADNMKYISSVESAREVLNVIEPNPIRQWQFILTHFDSFGEQSRSALVATITQEYKALLATGINDAEKVRLLNFAPDFMGLMRENEVHKVIVADFMKTYTQSREGSSASVKAQTKEPSQVRLSYRKADNMNWKDNCVKSLLGVIFP